MKRETFLGSISLTKLKHETIVHGGKKGIFIPVEENPSIYFQVKDDGSKIINLDIEVKPTPNGNYGNTHMIKCNVGKANREKYGLKPEQIGDNSPILGNLKRFEFEVRDNGQDGAPAGADYGAPSEQNMPPEFDGNW